MAQRYFLVLSLLLSGGNICMAQTDTTQLLEVSVVENRTSVYAVGSEVKTIDSLALKNYSGQTLGELLSFESSIFIKNYSPGNLASSSFRGANSQQTVVTWNGFNINSPLNGQFDLSLFPVQSFDEICVQPGASSALWGSGAIGGSIHLGHKPDFRKHLSIGSQLSLGSFNYQHESAVISIGNKKISSRMIFLHHFAKNDFEYLHPFSEEVEKQRHNAVRTKGFLSENALSLNERNLLSLDFWWQQSDRNLPPSLFETTLSNQKDEVVRITSQWFHQFKKSKFKLRAAYFSEDQYFHNITADTLYHNANETFIGEAELNFNIHPKHSVDLGINSTSYLTDVEAFVQKNLWQHRQAFFAGYRWFIIPELDFSTMLRQEIVDKNAVPFTFTSGLSWAVTDEIAVKGQFSKIYRTPTLNDQYWNPGGNEDLLSESGYAQELNAAWTKNLHQLDWKISATAYNRNVKNWIIWIPIGGISSPQNLLSVWSRGIETSSHVAWRHNKLYIKLNFLSNYVLSTNERSERKNDASVGRQLIYTPAYTNRAGLQLLWKKISFSYSHSYTGYTYTSSDNSQFIEPYDLANIYMNYKQQWKKLSATFFIKINNVWDENYQVVKSRPMPGINFNVGINLNININKL